MQRNACVFHVDEGYRQHERNGNRHHHAGPEAKADEADDKDDGDGFEQRRGEARHRLIDDGGLIGHPVHIDTNWQIRHHAFHLRIQRLAEMQQVRAGFHADCKADGRLAVETEQRGRRIDITAPDRRYFRQREKAVVDAQVDRPQTVFRRELAADAKRHALRSCIDEAGLGDGILRLQRLDDGLLINAERRDLSRGKFQIDRLVLCADDIDLADIVDGQDLGAGIFHQVTQLPLAETVAGEGVDIAINVAETVIEEGADHAGWKLALDVADHVAHPHPGRFDIARLGFRHQLHKDRRAARHRLAAQMIEIIEFLELLLDPVGHLPRHFLRRGAGPLGTDHHGLDGEVRVFLATEVEIGKNAGENENQHEIPDKRTVFERPV